MLKKIISGGQTGIDKMGLMNPNVETLCKWFDENNVIFVYH